MPVLSNSKHEAVAQAYLADPAKIGWRAYKIYPKSSRHAAETMFGRMLKNVEFQTASRSSRPPPLKVRSRSPARSFEELTKIGLTNMQDYMLAGPDGAPMLDFSQLTRDSRPRSRR
jgi:hypothetical protein